MLGLGFQNSIDNSGSQLIYPYQVSDEVTGINGIDNTWVLARIDLL